MEKPSGPRALPFGKLVTTPSKSDILTGLIRESFISLVTTEGIQDKIVFSSISVGGKSSEKRAE